MLQNYATYFRKGGLIMSSHFKLNGKNAHWLIACATTAFALGYYGGITGHADTVTSSETTTSQLAPSNTLKTDQSSPFNMESQSSVTDINSQSNDSDEKTQPATTINQQPMVPESGTMSDQDTTEISQDSSSFVDVKSPSKVTNANSDINLNNIHYHVSMQIQLATGTYDVVYLPTSPDDLYLGDDNGTPISTPVDAGTYKVWLSKQGYDNIVAGKNFWVSKDGGPFQFFAVWDIMQNIDIGEYDPLQFGYGTYTINPYNMEATITGNQTLTADNPILDPSKYQISFSGMDPNDRPFDEISPDFSYTFQQGDLMLDPDSLNNNQYRVILSQQGLSNVKAALAKAFNNNANNFSLLTENIANQGVASVMNEPMTIIRDIIVHYPDGRDVTHRQAVTINRTYKLNDQCTGITFSSWSTAQWTDFQVPNVDGYVATPNVIPAVDVTSETSNATIDIYYQTNPGTNQPGENHPTNGSSSNSGNVNQTNTTTNNANNRLSNTSLSHLDINSQKQPQSQQLPQTGNDSSVITSLVGLMFASLTSLLGISRLSRKRS